jgi:hypothetical protein
MRSLGFWTPRTRGCRLDPVDGAPVEASADRVETALDGPSVMAGRREEGARSGTLLSACSAVPELGVDVFDKASVPASDASLSPPLLRPTCCRCPRGLAARAPRPTAGRRPSGGEAMCDIDMSLYLPGNPTRTTSHADVSGGAPQQPATGHDKTTRSLVSPPSPTQTFAVANLPERCEGEPTAVSGTLTRRGNGRLRSGAFRGGIARGRRTATRSARCPVDLRSAIRRTCSLILPG